MPSYETLDIIADSYIPGLLLLAIYLLLKPLFKDRNYRVFFRRVLQLLSWVVITYGLRFLDNYYQLFPSVDLDYSTHTAAASLLCLFIVINLPKNPLATKLILAIGLSLFSYFGLMLYQQYHTLADIVSTLILVLSLTYASMKAIEVKLRK